MVVFERASGLTPADSAAITAEAAELANAPGLDGQPTSPFPSADGKALILPVSGKDPHQAGEDVNRIREMLGIGLPDGLRAPTTGPGGYGADFADVFRGIDGRLLLVTAAVVAVILVLVYRSPSLPVVVLISAASRRGPRPC